MEEITGLVEHSNFVRMEDVKQATNYAEKGITPEDYYKRRWDETIQLSDELSEKDKIQWTKPQLLLMGGLPRSGKSTVATTIERQFVQEGIPCRYFGSDLIRNKIKDEIEAQLLLDGFEVGSTAFADEREKRLYSDENRQRVYNALYKKAGEFMRESNGIAIVDATHITQDKRENAYNAIMEAYEQNPNGETDSEVNSPSAVIGNHATNREGDNAASRQGETESKINGPDTVIDNQDANREGDTDGESGAELDTRNIKSGNTGLANSGGINKEIKQPDFTYIEVSNDIQQALDIFEKDKARIDAHRKGFNIGQHGGDKLQKPGYLPYDISEAHPKTRIRDEKLYEPIMTKHIKVINKYSTPEELINHVQNSMLAQKPETISSLMDIDDTEDSDEWAD